MTGEAEIRVRIVQLGKQVFHYEGRQQSTVGEVLKAAGVKIDPLRTDLRINGEVATGGTVLCDGDIITVLPPIKGGGGLMPRRRQTPPSGSGRFRKVPLGINPEHTQSFRLEG